MSVVNSAEFQRNLELYQDKALTEPVMITRNGHERLVLLSAEEYQRLKRRDRRVFTVDEVTDADIAAIEAARVPEEYNYLDDELKDWKP